MIIIADNLLTELECNQLIGLASGKLIKAKTLGNQNFRTAENTWLDDSHEVVSQVKLLVSTITSSPISHQEQVHIVRYGTNGEYKEHHDYFEAGYPTHDSALKERGQRTHTCLFYLNENFVGGETRFTKKNLNITPKTGRMVVWTNTLPNKLPDESTLHAGLPVTEGEKWLCIVWVRERP